MILQTVVTNDVINPAVYDPIVKLISRLSGQEFNDLTIWAILIRLLLAFMVGAVLGAERATKSHAAGLRTYILVALGSCVGMLVNLILFQRADTSRIGAGVVSGIGFIGAGTIITTSRNGSWKIVCATIRHNKEICGRLRCAVWTRCAQWSIFTK